MYSRGKKKVPVLLIFNTVSDCVCVPLRLHSQNVFVAFLWYVLALRCCSIVFAFHSIAFRYFRVPLRLRSILERSLALPLNRTSRWLCKVVIIHTQLSSGSSFHLEQTEMCGLNSIIPLSVCWASVLFAFIVYVDCIHRLFFMRSSCVRRSSWVHRSFFVYSLFVFHPFFNHSLLVHRSFSVRFALAFSFKRNGMGTWYIHVYIYK